jgi:hypothetical protein
VYFFVGWMAWTMDGYDFHSVSLSVSRLATYYGEGMSFILAMATTC